MLYYPKNPLVRMRRKPEIDWERMSQDIEAHLPAIKNALRVFLEENALWGGQAFLGNFPPHIKIKLHLKPGAYPRRKTIVLSIEQPERMAVVPDEELDLAAAFVASVLEICPELTCRLFREEGYVTYNLKVGDYSQYKK